MQRLEAPGSQNQREEQEALSCLRQCAQVVCMLPHVSFHSQVQMQMNKYVTED